MEAIFHEKVKFSSFTASFSNLQGHLSIHNDSLVVYAARRLSVCPALPQCFITRWAQFLP